MSIVVVAVILTALVFDCALRQAPGCRRAALAGRQSLRVVSPMHPREVGDRAAERRGVDTAAVADGTANLHPKSSGRWTR
jgi:hypothetical protein